MKYLVAVGIISFCVNVHANETSFGAAKCNEWNKNSDMHLSQITWVAGYLSGLNHASTQNSKSDPLHSVKSIDEIIVWMDKYCQAQPASSIQIGSDMFFDKLNSKNP